MKKLLLLFLLIAGGVSTASATWYLKGSFNSWGEGNPFDGDGIATVSLSAGTPYTFKLYNSAGGGDNGWYGCNSTMYWYSRTDYRFYGNNGDCTIQTVAEGDYKFIINTSGDNPEVTVIYPNMTTVYFYNNLGWTTPHVYLLGSSYWDATNGTGSYGREDGRDMTKIGDTDIWKLEYPLSLNSQFIAFTRDLQNGYGSFGSNAVVYREDFSTSTPVYVPDITSNETHYGSSYYNFGEWKAYAAPTGTPYVRDITSVEWGTICLPYNATVTGAKVYKIVSKVMDDVTVKGINLEEVDNLVAGHAYIFHATSNTLTATYTTSNYTSSSDADGMLGNLGGSKVTVPDDGSKFVIQSNKLKQVVSGGSGVTCGQYKAYITLTDIGTATPGARGAYYFGPEDNEATAIENLTTDHSENVVYDLQGRRVAQPTKGLYIVNGKKVIK